MQPYVTMSISIEVENVASTNPDAEMIAPAIHTGRHPNLFTIALANGPDRKTKPEF